MALSEARWDQLDGMNDRPCMPGVTGGSKTSLARGQGTPPDLLQDLSRITKMCDSARVAIHDSAPQNGPKSRYWVFCLPAVASVARRMGQSDFFGYLGISSLNGTNPHPAWGLTECILLAILWTMLEIRTHARYPRLPDGLTEPTDETIAIVPLAQERPICQHDSMTYS